MKQDFFKVEDLSFFTWKCYVFLMRTNIQVVYHKLVHQWHVISNVHLTKGDEDEMAVEMVSTCCRSMKLVTVRCSVQDYTEEIELWNSAPNVGRVTYFCSLIFDPSLFRSTYYYLYKHNFHLRLVPSSILEVESGTCTSLVESCHHSMGWFCFSACSFSETH